MDSVSPLRSTVAPDDSSIRRTASVLLQRCTSISSGAGVHTGAPGATTKRDEHSRHVLGP